MRLSAHLHSAPRCVELQLHSPIHLHGGVFSQAQLYIFTVTYHLIEVSAHSSIQLYQYSCFDVILRVWNTSEGAWLLNGNADSYYILFWAYDGNQNAIRETSFNAQNSPAVPLPTQGMPYPQRCFKQAAALTRLADCSLWLYYTMWGGLRRTHCQFADLFALTILYYIVTCMSDYRRGLNW
jgi:hypothetical protein